MLSSVCRAERGRQPTSKRSLVIPATRGIVQKTSDLTNVQYHAAFTVLLTILIATSLWMILMIYHPFGGEVHVSPDAFRHAIYVINSLPG